MLIGECRSMRLHFVCGKATILEARELFRTSFTRWGLAASAAAVLGCAVTMSGCGNQSAETSATPTVSPMSAPAAKVAASGPAISDKLPFNQLALDTPAKSVNKQGLVFLEFTYTNNDGNVYKCVLPQAMSEGTNTIDDWYRTFAIYRLPTVIKQKKIKTGPGQINDFPFISPRPQAAETPKAPEQPKPVTMPQMPTSGAPGPGVPAAPAMPPGMGLPRPPSPGPPMIPPHK